MSDDFESQVAGVATLHDPVRRELYQFVVGSPDPVSRDEAAAGVGIQRSLAAFHLDKLAAEGLLKVEYRRLTGRTGPGAGRSAKLYQRSDREFAVSLPPREYELAARLLAQAVESARHHGEDLDEALVRVAASFGEHLGREAVARAGRSRSRDMQRRAVLEVLRDQGFQPHAQGSDIVLSNCPFHALSAQFTDLVCTMNLQVMESLRGELSLPADDLDPRLEPSPGRCCVKFCTDS